MMDDEIDEYIRTAIGYLIFGIDACIIGLLKTSEQIKKLIDSIDKLHHRQIIVSNNNTQDELITTPDVVHFPDLVNHPSESNLQDELIESEDEGNQQFVIHSDQPAKYSFDDYSEMLIAPLSEVISLPDYHNIKRLSYTYDFTINKFCNLPNKLQTLDVRHNRNLTKLPDKLPSNMTSLSCCYNMLCDLPLLPIGLSTLSVDSNYLFNLSENMAELVSINWLSFANNMVYNLSMRVYPSSWITCNNNSLLALPEYDDMIALGIKYPKFLNMPEVDIRRLLYLVNGLGLVKCDNNGLCKLPDNLPPSIWHLECDYNKVAEIPSGMYKLKDLYCGYNDMFIYPSNVINSEMIEVWCDGNTQMKYISSHDMTILHEIYANNMLNEGGLYRSDGEYKINMHATGFCNYKNIEDFFYLLGFPVLGDE